MALSETGPAAEPYEERGLEIARQLEAVRDVDVPRVALCAVRGRGVVARCPAEAGAQTADLESGVRDQFPNVAPPRSIEVGRIGVRRARCDLDPVEAEPCDAVHRV